LAILQQNKRDDARLFLENRIIPFILLKPANTGLRMIRKVKTIVLKSHGDIILIQSLTIFF